MTPDYDTAMSITAADTGSSLTTKYSKTQKQAAETTKRNRSASPSENYFNLPDPEYRQVPGNVRRRTDRTVRAEPPPTNPPRPSSTAQNRRPNRRSRKGKGLANDSGSDSDDDHRKLGKDDDDDRTVVRRRAQPGTDEDLPSQRAAAAAAAAAAALEAEEQERIRLLRTLGQVEAKWAGIREHRQKCRREGVRRRQELLLRHDSRSLMYNTGFPAINRQNNELKDYLKEALFRDIEGKPRAESEDSAAPDEYLEEVVEQVELGVIRRCSKFDDLQGFRNREEPEIEERLVSIIESMQRYLWQDIRESEVGPEDATEAAKAFVRTNCPATPNDAQYGKSSAAPALDGFVETYMAKITCALATAAMRDMLADLNSSTQQRLWLCRCIENSRNSSGLTDTYLTWLCSGISREQIMQCCREWRQESQERNSRTEFCPNIVQPGVVSLLEFKAHRLLRVKDVSRRDLHRVGWFLDTDARPEVVYWRWEIYKEYAWSEQSFERSWETLFQVSMDGEVLGMLTTSRQCLAWDPQWAT